jgi:hypothetical protein
MREIICKVLKCIRRFIFCGLEPAADRVAEGGGEALAGWMGASAARRTDVGGLHDCARAAPSRAGLHVGASVGIQDAGCGDFGWQERALHWPRVPPL